MLSLARSLALRKERERKEGGQLGKKVVSGIALHAAN